MDALKFAVGQVWKTREGKSRVIFSIDGLEEAFPVNATDIGGADINSYTLTGHFYGDKEQSGLDLVELVKPSASTDDTQAFRDQLIILVVGRRADMGDSATEIMNFVDTIMDRRTPKVDA